jgi:Flp pilus assembly protein TadG
MTGFRRTPAIAPWLRDCRGGPAVEFGSVLPILILFIYGVIEFGRLMSGIIVLHFAVQEAARCAVVSASSACCTSASNCSNPVANAVKNFAASYATLAVGWGITASNFTVGTCTEPNGGTGVKVSTTNVTFTTPVLELLPNHGVLSISVGAQACYPT